MRTKDKPGVLATQHFERCHELDREADASVGNLDSARRGCGPFARHDDVLSSVCLRDEVMVGDLQEGADRGRLVVAGRRPVAYRGQRSNHGKIWRHEERGI